MLWDGESLRSDRARTNIERNAGGREKWRKQIRMNRDTEATIRRAPVLQVHMLRYNSNGAHARMSVLRARHFSPAWKVLMSRGFAIGAEPPVAAHANRRLRQTPRAYANALAQHKRPEPTR